MQSEQNLKIPLTTLQTVVIVPVYLLAYIRPEPVQMARGGIPPPRSISLLRICSLLRV